MIQSIQDYENWRDSQYDRPAPDADGPDERSVRFYSHDYPADTSLEYTRTGDHAELRLAFNSEDPELRSEELVYGGENAESMPELVSDLRAELTSYLDAADTSSFAQQQGVSDNKTMADDFSEYTRTALYAFEAILKKTEKERELTALRWEPIDMDQADLLYSASSEEDRERGCVGHLRGDFGRGVDEFWTSWFDHQPGLNTEAFRNELRNVVDILRRNDGLLKSFASMSRNCRDGSPIDDSYGFRAETKAYRYFLRCTPRRGDYNFYLYAYDKNAQREYAREKTAAEKMQHEKMKIKKNNMER